MTVTAAFSNTNTYPTDQTVTVSVGGTGTATADTDYAAVSNFDVTIDKGKTSGTATFTLTPTQDTLVEGNETIGVAGSATGLTVNGTTLTLTDDDDDPTVGLTLNPSSVGEGASGTTVTVTAAFSNSSTYSVDKTVTVSVGGSGTATSGTDYAAVSNFDVTIDKGKTSGTATFTLTPTQDTLIEGNETVGVAGSVTGLTVNGTTLTLTDDDATPAVNLSLNPSSLGEGASATTVTVRAEFSNTSTFKDDKTVTVSVGGSGTATSGTDYAAVSNFDVTIDKGKTSGTATFTLTPTQDTLIEGNETVGVAGSATGLTVNKADLTLTDDDGAPAVNLSLNPSSVREDASETTVTVTAAFNNTSTYGVDKKVTVTVGKTGTATSGTDYAVVSNFDVTIDKGKTSGTETFTLTPTQDTLVEGNETIGVAGSVAGLTVNGADLTLNDDDAVPTINLSLNPSTVGEGASATTVTVTAAFSNSSTYGTAKKVTVTVGGTGEATSGTDYAAVSSFELTIAKGETSGTATFTLTPKQDTLVEGNETIGVAGSATGLTVNGADLTLTDDEAPPAVNLSLNPSSVSEGASGTTVTVTAAFSNNSTYETDTTVTVSVGGTGTATSGTDYAAVSSFNVTITKRKKTGTATFTLTPTQDTLIEGNETVGVAGTATGLTVNGTELTLTDDDGDPVVNLSLSPSSVGEGDGATRVTVTAAFSNSSTYRDDKKVTVTVGGTGTATSGTDYAAVSNFDVTIAKGQTSGTATFTLTPTADTLVEGNETIGLAGSTTGLTVNGAEATLTDDDGAPVVNLTAAPGTVDETDGATTVKVTATFASNATYEADKTVTVAVGGSGSTATSGTDYAAVSGFDVTIAAGQTSGSADFTLTPTADTVPEGDETIGVAGSVAGLTVNGTQLTLTDDDDADGLSVNLTAVPDTVGEGDGATTVTVTATFSDDITFEENTTVTVTVGQTGTATSGTDYAAVPSFDVTIRRGQTSGAATFTLTPTQDEVVEGDETIGVAGSATGLPVNGTELTLTDDDAGSAVNLTVEPSSVGEGAPATSVTVTAAFSSGSSTYAADTIVTVSVGGGGTATSGTDFAAVPSFDVTIPAGRTSGAAAFTLTPTQDSLIEGDETIGVAGAATVLTVNGTELTLTDDDKAALAIGAATGTEGDEAVAFTVTLTPASTAAVSVSYATVDGTAVAGQDFTATTGRLTFAAGETSRTVAVPLIDDDEIEEDEAFAVVLDGPANAVVDVAEGAGTISDNDEPTVSVLGTTVVENAGNAVFTITFDRPALVPITLAFATEDGTAKASPSDADGVTFGDPAAPAGDYVAEEGEVTFAPGQTMRLVSVPVVDDQEVEPTESFILRVHLAGDADRAQAAGSGTIEDDDLSALSISETTVLESDGTADVKVTVDPPSPRPVTVWFRTEPGTATAGADYEETRGRLSFAPGDTERTISVPVLQDALVEPEETFVVALRNPEGAVLARDGESQNRILDDEVVNARAEATSKSLYVLARSVASEAVEAIGERFGGGGGGGVQANLGAASSLGSGPGLGGLTRAGGAGFGSGAGFGPGASMAPWSGPGATGMHGRGGVDSMSSAAMLANHPFPELAWMDGGTFEVPLGAGADEADEPGPSDWTVWGRAGATRTSLLGASGTQVEAELFTTHLGVETRLGRPVLLGAAVSHSAGSLGYELSSSYEEASSGTVDGAVTSVQPYIHWAARRNLTVWALGGVGGGDLTLVDGIGAVETPVALRMVAGGGRQGLNAGGDLALKVDAFHATLSSEEQQGLAASSGTATRVRTLVEKELDWSLSDSSVLRPSVEAGVRWDGGSDVTGAGAEVGGGVEYKHAGLGLSLEASGRYLVAHQADGFEEWGAGLALRFGPGVGASGPWVSLEPTWGNAFSQVQGLWDPQASPVLTPGQRAQGGPDRVATTAGYRFGEAGDVQVALMRDRRGGGVGPEQGGASLGLQVQGTLQWGGADRAEGSAGGG